MSWFQARLLSVFSFDDCDKNRELELQAVTLFEDGLNYRSINHNLGYSSLKCYRFYKQRSVQYAINTLIACLLLLIFIEKPSSISISSDPNNTESETLFELPVIVAECIELVIIFLMLLDMSMDFYIERSNAHRRQYWLLGHLVFSLLAFAELLINNCVTTNLMYRKMFRPFYLIRRSTLIKKMIKCVVSSVKQLLTVLMILAVTLIAFTVVAMLLFDGEPKNTYAYNAVTEKTQVFPDFMTGLESLLVLATTANNPTVMMPAFSDNRLYALFFMFYLLISLIFTNILIAILYTHFTTFFEDSVRGSILRRRVAFKACFCCLQELELACQTPPDVSEPSKSKSGSDFFEVAGPQVKVHVSRIEACVNEVHFRKTARKVSLLKALQSSPTVWYTYDAFLKKLINHLETPKKVKIKSPIVSAKIHWLQKLQEVMISEKGIVIGQIISFSYFAFLVFSAFELGYEDLDGKKSPEKVSMYAMHAFFISSCVCYSFLEVWSFGIRRYKESPNRVLDCLCSFVIGTVGLVSAIELILHGRSNTSSNEKINTVAVVIKCGINMFHVEHVRVVMETLWDLVTNLIPFAAILMSAYYSFAVLGIICFQDMIAAESNVTEHLINLSYPAVTAPCGSYEQLQYWPTNFNDFYAACVLLWDIMIVNNWNVFLDVFTRRSGTKWSKLYFVLWWLVSNVILLNTLTSLTIETLLFRLTLPKNHELASNEESKEDNQTTSFIENHSHTDMNKVERRSNQNMSKTINYDSLYDIVKHSKRIQEPDASVVEHHIKMHPSKSFSTIEEHCSAGSSSISREDARSAEGGSDLEEVASFGDTQPLKPSF